MSDKPLDLKELKAIVDWVGATGDIHEFSLKYGDVELFVSRSPQSTAAPRQAAPAPARVPSAAPAPAPSSAAASGPKDAPAAAAQDKASTTDPLGADEVLIKAPMVGTFYASSKPGAPEFVSVGDAVQPDTVLCIVEVMKLMNNIEAGTTGTVARILVENEQAVEYGQPLMVIKRSA